MQGFQIGSWRVYLEINTIADQEEVRIEPQVMKVLAAWPRIPDGS